MSDVMVLLVTGLWGAVLGAAFFGGLWWGIRKAVGSSNPALWIAGSLLVRTAVVVAGFRWGAWASLPRLGACLAGFLVARWAVKRFLVRGSAAHASES